MIDDEVDIGLRLRAVRSAHGLSQRELARKAGVSNGLISHLEKNRSSPSVSSLKRILDAIPISLADFFSNTARTRRGEENTLQQPLMQAIYPIGFDTGIITDPNGTGVMAFVVSGQIEVTVNGQTSTFQAGESYFVDMRLPHRLRTLGAEDCVTVRTAARTSSE